MTDAKNDNANVSDELVGKEVCTHLKCFSLSLCLHRIVCQRIL